MIENIIKFVADKGLSHTVYLMSAAFGAMLMMIYSLWYSRKIGIISYKAISAIAIGSIIVLKLMDFFTWIAQLFARYNFLGIETAYNSMIRTYIYVPIIAWVIAIVLKIDWEKLCDLFSFSQPFIWGTTSIGCLFTGCCRGYPCEWGLYNTRTCEKVFPIQFVNFVILISITIILFLRSRKNNYIVDGKSYLIMLILVGSTRFITEFFMDNEKIFLGCSDVSFHCIIMVFVGIIALKTLKRRKPKSN